MHALESWHDFFVLVGTAGATLLALLFVAVRHVADKSLADKPSRAKIQLQ
jgi:hypothetical protein